MLGPDGAGPSDGGKHAVDSRLFRWAGRGEQSSLLVVALT